MEGVGVAQPVFKFVKARPTLSDFFFEKVVKDMRKADPAKIVISAISSTYPWAIFKLCEKSKDPRSWECIYGPIKCY